MPRLDRTREHEPGGVHEALLRAVAVTGLMNGESVLADPDREAVEVQQADLVQVAVAQLTHQPIDVMPVRVQGPPYEQRPRLTGEIAQQRHPSQPTSSRCAQDPPGSLRTGRPPPAMRPRPPASSCRDIDADPVRSHQQNPVPDTGPGDRVV